MNNIVIKKDKSSIFTSILFLILGILLYTNANGMIKFITYIVGVIFVVFGSIKLYDYYKSKESVSNINFTLGILSIIIGIIVMFCNDIIEQAIRLVMGGFIVASGLNKIIVSLNSKTYNKNWIGLLVVGLFLIGCGLYTILKTNLILQAIGVVLIVYSSIDILSYLLYPKNRDIIK